MTNAITVDILSILLTQRRYNQLIEGVSVGDLRHLFSCHEEKEFLRTSVLQCQHWVATMKLLNIACFY